MDGRKPTRHTNLNKKEPVPPCDASCYFLDRVYQILGDAIKDIRGLNQKSALLPVDWKEFIERYIKYPSPFFKTNEDPLNNPPGANKKKMDKTVWQKRKHISQILYKTLCLSGIHLEFSIKDGGEVLSAHKINY